MTEPFWQLNVGHILTIASLLVAFWTAHFANVKRIKDATERFAKVEAKVEILYDWFRDALGRMSGQPTDRSGD